MTRKESINQAEEQPSSGPDWSILEKLNQKYAATERPLVDQVKADIEERPGRKRDYDFERARVSPNFAQKMGRMALDLLRIKIPSIEEKRRREAISVALDELNAEEAAHGAELDTAVQRQMEESAPSWADVAAEEPLVDAKRKEAEELEHDMSMARNYFETHKDTVLYRQRVQEIVERKLNNKLLSADTLEDEVLSENPGIRKRTIAHEGVEIPVYDLCGLPYSMLTTTIDYRSANQPGDIGTETYRTVMDNPAVWMERRDQAEATAGFGTRKGDARGDTISASYHNSERNSSSYVPGQLIYGFSHVEADSIISISINDGGTSNMAGKAETQVSNINDIETLETASKNNNYNEVLLRRYSENGIPKRPDYIVTINGQISEAALRHASYYNIPIVNIEPKAYNERMWKRGEEILDSIGESDDYNELEQKITELRSLSTYKSFYHERDTVGRGRDIPGLYPGATQTEERCLDVSMLELKKRLEFIEETLKKATAEVQAATQARRRAPSNPSGFDYFNVSINDVQNSMHRTLFSDTSDSYRTVPGNYSSVQISFRRKGSRRNIETGIYDGANMFKKEEYLEHREYERGEIDKGDSSYYDRIEPLAREYFAAFRENVAASQNPEQ